MFRMLAIYFDVDAIDENGKTLLMNYITYNTKYDRKATIAIQLISNYSKDINIQDEKDGNTALHMLIYNYNNADPMVALVATMLQNGADPFIVANNRNSSIGIAIKQQNVGILHILLQNQKTEKKYVVDIDTLKFVINTGNLDLLNALLLKQTINLGKSENNRIILSYVLINNNDITIKSLFNGYCYLNDLESIKIISPYITSNIANNFVLSSILKEEKYEIFEYLIGNIIDADNQDNEDKETILMIHMRNGYIKEEQILRILEHVKNINLSDISGMTALHSIIRYIYSDDNETYDIKKYLSPIKLLLDKGADPTIRDHEGTSPIGHALILKDAFELLELLLNNMNVGMNSGIHASIYPEVLNIILERDYDYLEVLLKYIDLDEKDADGKTLLWHAQHMESPNSDIIELLKFTSLPF